MQYENVNKAVSTTGAAQKRQMYKWARSLPIKATELQALEKLILWSKDCGTVQAAQAAIAKHIKKSERTVKRAIAKLAKVGAIEIKYQFAKRGRQAPSIYILNCEIQPVTEGQNTLFTGGHFEKSTGCQNVPPNNLSYLPRDNNLKLNSYLEARGYTRADLREWAHDEEIPQ